MSAPPQTPGSPPGTPGTPSRPPGTPSRPPGTPSRPPGPPSRPPGPPSSPPLTSSGVERSGLRKRLPFLIVAGLGLLLWRAPFLPQERLLVFQLPTSWSEATRVDLQLYDAEGALLLRQERSFKDGAPRELSEKLSLRRGEYRALLFAQLPQGEKRAEAPLRLGGEETLVTPVR